MKNLRLFMDLVHTLEDHGRIEEAQMYKGGYISITVIDAQDETQKYTVSVVQRKEEDKEDA